MKSQELNELVLENILSREKEGATNRIIRVLNGKKYAFSDFYKFRSAKGAKVKAITTCLIEI